MPQLYSYIRWSSDRQDKGTNKSRQVAAAKAYAEEAGLELVEIIDPGVSAFRGKNRAGKLGDFIDAVKNNAIPSDSWLYCENLDRLSRDQVDEALRLFLELIGLGLTIVTGMDRKVYNRESIRQNPTDLMISILMFIRGNEESETKSHRTIGNVVALVERHKNGLPVNIKSVGRHPFWIDDSGSQYEAVKKHPVYWSIAREALDMFISGHGVYSVKRALDKKYPNGLRGKEWDYQVLKKMRDNRALIGERTIKVDGQSYKLCNYYPALCKDETEFLILAEKKKQNKFISKKCTTDKIRLLSGFSILRCSKCGGTMHSFMNKNVHRYICTNGTHKQKNCSGWSVIGSLVEHCTMIALLIGYINQSRKNGCDTTSIDEDIINKQSVIEGLNSKITNLTLAISIAKDVNELATLLQSLNTQREKLLVEIEKLKERSVSLKAKGSFEIEITDFLILIQYATFKNLEDENRNKIRKVIHSIIEFIVIDKTDSCITIYIKCYGIDEVFIFGGVQRKPYWRFDIGIINDSKLQMISNYDKNIGRTKERKNKEYLDGLRESYQGLYESAVLMLNEMGYPDINGALFWPNR